MLSHVYPFHLDMVSREAATPVKVPGVVCLVSAWCGPVPKVAGCPWKAFGPERDAVVHLLSRPTAKCLFLHLFLLTLYMVNSPSIRPAK